MKLQIKKASKKQGRLRLCLTGPSGSGKTFTALAVGSHFGKLLVIDTEQGSASLYAPPFSFDVIELGTDQFDPKFYVEALHAAAEAGAECVVIDSLSHAWLATLETADRLKASGEGRGSPFGPWNKAKAPNHDLVQAILSYPGHVIVTLRTKTEYEIQENDKGKKVPVKIGLKPIQEAELDYEFTVVMDLSRGGVAVVTKTRCPDLNDQTFTRPGADLAQVLKTWLSSGEEQAAPPRDSQALAVDFNGHDQRPAPRPEPAKSPAAPLGPPALDAESVFRAAERTTLALVLERLQDPLVAQQLLDPKRDPGVVDPALTAAVSKAAQAQGWPDSEIKNLWARVGKEPKRGAALVQVKAFVALLPDRKVPAA